MNEVDTTGAYDGLWSGAAQGLHDPRALDDYGFMPDARWLDLRGQLEQVDDGVDDGLVVRHAQTMGAGVDSKGQSCMLSVARAAAA